MYILTPEASLSIVAHKNNPELVVVRAWREGDLEAVFGRETPVHAGGGTHYRFRAELDRRVVADALAQEISFLNHERVVDAVSEPARRKAYGQISNVMARYQTQPMATSVPADADILHEPLGGADPVSRLVLTIAGFRQHRGEWPTRVIVPQGQLDRIRRRGLKPAGWKLLRRKLQLIPVPANGVLVAVGADGLAQSFGAAVSPGTTVATLQWLGFIAEAEVR